MTRKQNEKDLGDNAEGYARTDCFSGFGGWRRALISYAARSVRSLIQPLLL